MVCILRVITAFTFVGVLAAIQLSDQPYMRRINVALDRPAYSSKREFDAHGLPTTVNDGDNNTDPTVAPGCFQSFSADTEPYWLVDLGTTVNISSVSLTNRGDCCGDQLSDFVVVIHTEDPRTTAFQDGGAACVNMQTNPVPQGETKEFSCGFTDIPGSWVSVQKYGPLLMLCEVEVFEEHREIERPGVSCTFEETDMYTDCGLYTAPSSSAQWRPASGGNVTGPASDHTTEFTTNRGSFLYVSGSHLYAGQRAELVSSVIVATEKDMCVTFWYHMQGLDLGKLDLNLYDSVLNNYRLLWASEDRKSSAVWRKAQASAQLYSDNKGGYAGRLVISAISTNAGINNDIAIDDIRTTKGLCSFDIQSPVASVDCNFDDPLGSMCGYGHREERNADWIWTKLPSPEPGMGPTTATGYYMYTTGNSKLFSPTFQPTFPKSCVRFSYYIGGRGQLVVKATGDRYPTTLNGPSGSGWTQAEVELNTPWTHKLEFAASNMNSLTAIDNIKVQDRECSTVETLSCPFHTGDAICGFVQSTADDFDFAVRLPNSVLDTDPPADHTDGTGSGLYAPVQAGATGSKEARLHSPIIQSSSPKSCLVFWYVLRGESLQGPLSVTTSAPDLSNVQTVWFFQRGYSLNSPRDAWARAAVTVDTSQPIRITFTLRVAGAKHASAIDDVSLTKGVCASEKPVANSFSCTLDDPALCGIGQMNLGDTYDWLWASGPTPTLGTGPEKDHTSGQGSYLYMDTSSHAQQGSKSILYTPTIVPRFPRSCLTFAYHLQGVGRAKLTALFSQAPFSLPGASRVWTKNSGASNQWQVAQIGLVTPKPFKIFLEAVMLGQSDYTGDIAIDDIAITENECPSAAVSHVTCPFSSPSLCNFVQWPNDKFDWSGPARLTPINAGPKADHTGSNGFFMYLDSIRKTRGDFSLLASPVVVMSRPYSCLEFWYHMRSAPPATPGALAVYLTDPTLMVRRDLLWKMNRDQGSDWRRVALTIATSQPSRFVFQGLVGTPDKTTVALDDVQLNKGPCVFDRVFKNIKCDFDDSSICGFQQDSRDDFDWFQRYASVPDVASTGPSQDHTGTGKYMYIESSLPQKAGEKARLLTPLLKTTAPKNCLTFWYHMRGPSTGTLKVSVILSGNRQVDIWSKSGNQGNEWNMAALQTDSSPQPFRLMFEAIVGKGTSGDIAIDDVEFDNEPCPGQPRVNCDFSDSFLCGYKQATVDDFDWMPTRGDNSIGPQADHTTANGQFVYAGRYAPKSVLVSPSLNWKAMDSCLTFKLFMSGSDTGTLKAYLSPTGMLRERLLVWSKTGDAQHKDWEFVRADISTPYPVQIVLEGIRGPGSSGTIAVDDIVVLPHSCALNNVAVNSQVTQSSTGMGQNPSLLVDGKVVTNSGAFCTSTSAVDSNPNRWMRVDLGKSYEVHSVGVTTKLDCCANGTADLYVLVTAGPPDLSQGPPAPDSGTVCVFSPSSLALGRRAPLQCRQPISGRHVTLVRFNAQEPLALCELEVLATPAPDGPSPADCTFNAGFCGYTQLSSPHDDENWVGKAGSSPDNNLGTGSYIQLKSSLSDSTLVTAALQSPLLDGPPSKICLRFWYHMAGAEMDVGTLTAKAMDAGTGAIVATWSQRGSSPGQTGWTMQEMDIDMAAPLHFRFEATRFRQVAKDRLVADIGLDDVQVSNGTCYQVPWSQDPAYRCDRPTTPCATGRGYCDQRSHTCTCSRPSYSGLQCSAETSPCPTNPCERGVCYNRAGVSICSCPDGYYGNKCQHEMFHVECTYDKMTINIFPHGFSHSRFLNIRTPEIKDPLCPLLPMSAFNTVTGNKLAGRRWQGYARQFALNNDPCAGSAAVVSQTEQTRTYSRQVNVYYDPLGRHPTDNVLTLTCTAPIAPPPRVSLSVQELGTSTHSRPQVSMMQTQPTQMPTYVQFQLTLNIPNDANANEIKAEKCVATSGSSSAVVVENGCVKHPIGVMLYDGKISGTEFLMMRVNKVPLSKVDITLNCNIRLCDTSVNNFSCYKRRLCWSRRRRDTQLDRGTVMTNLVADLHFTGGRLANYTYTYTP